MSPRRKTPVKRSPPSPSTRPAGSAGSAELSVVLACASVSSRVTVDTSHRPPRIAPTNLLQRRLRSVGITDARLPAFKANLVALLPMAAERLSGLVLSPDMVIGDLVTLVAQQVLEERATAPTVFVKGEVAEARRRCRDAFGSELAAKSSDALVTELSRRAATLHEAVPSSADSDWSMIIECGETEAARESLREIAPDREPELVRAASMLSANHPSLRVGSHRLERLIRIGQDRDRFHKDTAAIVAEIEKQASRLASIAQAREYPPTEVCWLNGALRARTLPASLSEVAADRQITLIDLPRPLIAEMDVSGRTVAAPAFRNATSFTGRGVIVAVIDTEVELHPALAGRVIRKTNYTSEPWGSPSAHGTGVAGIIAAQNNPLGGIAPDATLFNYKVLTTTPQPGDDFSGSCALQQAVEDGAHIANCSWGNGPARDGTSREARACNKAWNRGLFIVKSAGNLGTRGRSSLTIPADAEGVLVVGGTDRRGIAVEGYSSQGPTRDGRTRPHLVAPGGSAGDRISGCQLNGTFGFVGLSLPGTSYAAAIVSGLAALLIDENPERGPAELRDMLVNACQPFDDMDPNRDGAGLVTMKGIEIDA